MKKYNSINGLRAIAAIGIIMLHVMSNVDYTLDNDFIVSCIKFFSEFVYLFMIISSFSMCCGYYEKIKNNQITMNEFYKKRFMKILPFFTFLVCINIIFERSWKSIYEGFTDITLMFGFLPVNSLDAIGVAWFLGVIFIFYMIFPFFVFLFDNKKRAWRVFIISFILNILCEKYFFSQNFGLINYPNRNNFLYDFVYFSLGGILYLYKDQIIEIVNKNKYISVIGTIIITILCFFITNKLFTLKMILIFTLWICIAIGIENNKILTNKFLKFISDISMELYLSHMVIFRFVQILNLTELFNNNYISYIMTTIIVLVGTIIFAILFNKIFEKIKMTVNKYYINK